MSTNDNASSTVEDDSINDTISRFTVNSDDSGIALEVSNDDHNSYGLSTTIHSIIHDAHLAASIRDDEKKLFCETTVVTWHGEFARLIMARALKYNIDYRLMLYDAFYDCPRAVYAKYSIVLIENAKAQFNCDHCQNCWTSMRARCLFYVSKPDEGAIILLKLYSQKCQYCFISVSPMWYFDEICRVMKKLAKTVFENFFPASIPLIQWDITHNGKQSVRRLYQRKGYMYARHNSDLCEACYLGLCYE